MRFYSAIEKEERDDWRAMTPTKLALEMLLTKQRDEEAASIGCSRLGDHNGATLRAGMATAFQEAINLMERDE